MYVIRNLNKKELANQIIPTLYYKWQNTIYYQHIKHCANKLCNRNDYVTFLQIELTHFQGTSSSPYVTSIIYVNIMDVNCFSP